jgi:hypothetical protein
MKTIATTVMILAAAAAAGLAQTWEFGAIGGGSFLPGVPVSGSAGSATAGFQTGFTAGAFVGQNLYQHLSGEIRYEFLQNNLRLSSGGTSAQFSGQAHAVHYDLIWHTARKESPLQFFAAVGGGMKIFRGTGAEEAYQPLSQFGYFTKTQAVKPMASVGGGLTYRLSQHVFLRAEFRDFITPFPTELITPAPGQKFGSLLQDFVPMVGLAYLF